MERCRCEKPAQADDYEFCGDAKYNEENDTYYWPEGWYEWNRYEETHWGIDDEITHWALIELPSNAEVNGVPLAARPSEAV